MNFISLVILKISPKFKVFLVGTVAVLVGVIAMIARSYWPQPLDNSNEGAPQYLPLTAQAEIAQVTPALQNVEIAQVTPAPQKEESTQATPASQKVDISKVTPESQKSEIAQLDDTNDVDKLDVSALQEADTPSGKSEGSQSEGQQGTTIKQVCAPVLSPCLSSGSSTHGVDSLSSSRGLLRTFGMSIPCLQDFTSCMRPWGTI